MVYPLLGKSVSSSYPSKPEHYSETPKNVQRVISTIGDRKRKFTLYKFRGDDGSIGNLRKLQKFLVESKRESVDSGRNELLRYDQTER